MSLPTLPLFLPFLGALLVALFSLGGKERAAVWMWLALVLILLAIFLHHISKPLQLTF